jgi:hypothetical protein
MTQSDLVPHTQGIGHGQSWPVLFLSSEDSEYAFCGMVSQVWSTDECLAELLDCFLEVGPPHSVDYTWRSTEASRGPFAHTQRLTR